MTYLSFLLIAVAGALWIGVSFWLGHDHDIDHDMDHDTDHDTDHDADHGHGLLSGFFGRLISPKVLGIFIAFFGGVGGIARYSKASVTKSSIYGALGAVAISLVTAFFMNLIYRQQANSLKQTATLKGSFGTVEVEITETGHGDVMVENQVYLSRSIDNVAIPKGARVKVVDTEGGILLVRASPTEEKTA